MNRQTRNFTVAAMLSAVSFVLAFLRLPMPLAPAFAQMDLSDLPALLAAFSLGPSWAVLVELVKNLLQLFHTRTGGVGELANFLMGSVLCLAAGLIYRRRRSKRMAALGCAAGCALMAAVAALVNVALLFPLYQAFMPLDELIAAFSAIVPWIDSTLDVVLWSIIPSNLCKGAVLAVLVMLIYKPLSPVLKGRF